jgi:Prokaryotic RING finger family 1
VRVGPEEAGRPCPYCRFPLKVGVSAERCPSCGAVHHDECWLEGGGCAILGCASSGETGEASPPEARDAERAAPPQVDAAGRRGSRFGPLWLFGLILAALGVGAIIAALVLVRHDTARQSVSRVTVTTQVRAVTPPTVTTPPSSPADASVGVPAVYRGRFTSVDRLERCVATPRSVTCGAAPSAKVVRLAGGRAVYVGRRPFADEGGPSMPEGTSFTTPGERISCASSSRGITCKDRTSGSAFVIGDYDVRISNPRIGAVPARRGYLGRVASVDRLQRCSVSASAVVCTSAPSGEGVRLVAGLGVTKLGHIGSTDEGGPAMAEGTSFATPSGSIRCESSRRGITCSDLTGSGESFTIGDWRIVTTGSGAGSAARGVFASIDRRERCRATASAVVCVAAPSRKEARLELGAGASYEGLGDTTDHGGPALPFGATVTVAGGAIRCSSSIRGISCRTRSGGSSFVLGDRRVIVENGRKVETH